GEGFSFQLFRKIGGNEDDKKRKPKTQKHIFTVIPVNAFIEHWISHPERFQFILFDDGSLHMCHIGTLELLEQLNWKDHKTRPGTKIASQKGKDWVPYHDLALSVHLNPSSSVIDLDLKSARMYLKG